MTSPAPVSEDSRRVSPVTPLIKAWKVAAALVALVFWQGGDYILDSGFPALKILGIIAGVVFLAAVISLVYNYFAWRRLAYGFIDESIFLHQGIFFRSQRHVRLDRIQAVNLNRPLLARICGLVSLRVSSAGGINEHLDIQFVKDAEGERLRKEILARAAGLKAESGEEAAPDAPEHKLLSLPTERVVGSLVRSLSFLISILIVLGTIGYVVFSRNLAGLTALLVPIVVQVTYWWGRVNNSYDFSVATSPDGIRLRSGLLATTARTVPPGRVQAIQLTQPVLWRRKNWWRATMIVAGEGFDFDRGESDLYPVATQEESALLLSLVLPDLGDEDPLGLLNAALVGNDNTFGFITSPRSARWVNPIAWRRSGYRGTPTATIIRRGRIVRTTTIVPNARIQSIGTHQGPIDRKLGIADAALHTVPGLVSPVVEHLAESDARAFVERASVEARAARAAAGPERWMEHQASSEAGEEPETMAEPEQAAEISPESGPGYPYP